MGLARDHDTGDPVALAKIELRGSVSRNTLTSERGLYDLDHLVPGDYTLVATFAGQPYEVSHVAVHAGTVTPVDILFTLGRPDPIHVDYGSAKDSLIDRYRPKNLSDQVGTIEGTVNDTQTRERVVGAVVTAVAVVANADLPTQQTISDEHGRFKFEAVRPGTYSVSAYYSISGRGQIEVLRNGITVSGAEAVVVPLWIEMTR
jgi:uncharacterized surface anchored protein